MAMEIGDINATSGMAKAIYDQLDGLIKPDLGQLEAKDLETIRKSWRKLALAVATGVIQHIQANMEIKGVQTRGSVTVSGSTGGTAAPIDVNHHHGVNLTAPNVTFAQVAATGSVE